jgi:predicted HTH domain antitoxin
MQIVIEVPDHYLANQKLPLITQQLKLWTALLLFQSGQLSRGAACEWANVDIYTFLAACRDHQISVINSSPEELEAEWVRVDQVYALT